MTIEYTHKTRLALPPPDEANYCEVSEIPTVSIPVVVPEEKLKPVYGRDLNDTDLLLVGANGLLKKIITDEYGINERFSWEYPEAFSTTSRKVIVKDGRNALFIKEKPKYCCNKYSLDLSATFQEHLSKKTDFVPTIIPTKSNNVYLRVSDRYFFVTEYKEGRMFNGSVDDVEKAGEVLGTIHLQSELFEFVDAKPVLAKEDSLQFVDLADRLPNSSEDEWKDKTIATLRSTVDAYKTTVDNKVEYIANHGDYAPFNLVYDKDGNIVAVNDFDNVNFRPRMRDLAGGLLSFCDALCYAGATSTLRKPISTSFNIEKAKKFVEAYVKSSKPLSQAEKDSLEGEICIRWVKIMALGIVRGDFNYKEVLEATPFLDFVRANLKKVI